MSIYTTDKEKISLIRNKKKLIDTFWVCLIGFLGLRLIAPEQKYLEIYLKKYYLIDRINLEESDVYSDFVLGIKLLWEADLITDITWIKFIAWMKKIKKSGYTRTHRATLRKILSEVPFSKIVPNNYIFGDVKRFLAHSVTFEEILPKFYHFNIQQGLSYDFHKFANIVRKEMYGEN